MPTHIQEPRTISYPDAVRILSSEDVQSDLCNACKSLARSMTTLMQTFDSVTSELLRIDPQGGPMLTQWKSICKDFRELVWQSRVTAGSVSGRLKIFCTVVLPLATRNENHASSHSHRDKMQVLQSYMSISADHSTMTGSLADNAQRLSTALTAFHVGFINMVGRRAPSGHQELQALQYKISELDATSKRLYAEVGRLVGVEVTFLVFSAFRVISFLGRPGRARVARQRLALNGIDLAGVGQLYDHLDRTHNEISNADYAVQSSLRQSDSVARSSISHLASNQLITVEASLGLYRSIWSRLQTDCTDIYRWLHSSRNHPTTADIPPSVACYLESGSNLYTSLANALDVYVAEIDPSPFTNVGR